MIDALNVPRPVSTAATATPVKPRDPSRSFGQVLEEMTLEVDRLQQNAGAMVEGLATGRVADVHDVVTALDKAELSFRLMLEVRNRLIEAYREVSRTAL